jgi:murein tripeptide amidase MpaA
VSEPLRFDTYYPYAALNEHIDALIAAAPSLLTRVSIGKSYEGRDIWLITATNSETGPAADKPAFWCDANIHATEVSASSALLYLLNKLVTGYGRDPEVTRVLDTRAFYIVPRVNPDGAELYFSETPKYIRSSTRPYPYDEEPLEGLDPSDIDGDGRILSMRFKDPNGAWKKSETEPRLMVRRDPTEQGGEYYRILPEGLLKDWDGVTFAMRKTKEGLDLNRNFPAHWRQEVEQYGAGPFPGSEPEVYALIKFISEHPNITGGLTFHTFSGVLLRPYGTQPDDAMPAEDLWTYKAIGKKGTELTGYPAISVYHDFKYHPKEVITGVFDDWLYEHLGMYGWTVEIWCPQRQAGITEFKPIEWSREHPFEDDLKMLKWSDETLAGKGYIDWTPFTHPQLGEVEIGGWDVQYCFRNPPPHLLEKEIAPLADWAIFHALISPELKLASATATPVGDGAYKIQVLVDNIGWLPTYVSRKALERKTARGLVAEIALPEGAELQAGKVRQELGQLEGWCYKGPVPYGWTADASSERAKIEWIVTGKSGDQVDVTVRHQRAGVVRASITL